MKLPKDFREFIELAISENVPFLLIGGWAYNRYAEPRFTGDIDFFVEKTTECESKVRSVLTKFGFGSALPTESKSLFEKKVIMLGRPPNRIDILCEISGITFDQAWQNRETEMIDGVLLNFISLDDLVQNKLAAGREKDILDAKTLQRLKR
jgi:hypothetical protein